MKAIQTPNRRQQGVATLAVVMMLFFIVTLVAAYASRNLIFEQRTSANQYRSTQALEAAEAGLEWAFAMLNEGRITDACLPSASVADTTFRQRYLNIDPATGAIAVRVGASNPLYPTCVHDGTNWNCSCPSDALPALAVPGTAGTHPAFRIFFRTPPGGHSGLVQIFANGCTRLDDDCLKFTPGALTANPSSAVNFGNEGTAMVTVIAALAGGGSAAPQATLTARGNVGFGSAATPAAIYNGDSASGLTVRAHGSVDETRLALGSAPGSPSVASVVRNDGGLDLNTERMFASVFNMWRDTFRQQPAALVVNCDGTCSAAPLRSLISLNPGRPIWVNGNLAIDSAGDIGAPNAPVALVVNGSLDFGASATNNIYGLVYVTAADWASAGTAQLHGAVVAEGNVGGTGSPTLIYDPALLQQLRVTTGSFVRLPGSWKDYW
jgi:hypothetical protein